MTNTQNLPTALKESALFCVWKKEERGGKPTKIPYNPITGGKAQPNNKATFAPFQTAATVMESYDGLGIGIFDGLCAIDIDHCIKDGKPSEMAADIISTMDSYTEYSPSGSGVHIYFTVSAGFQYNKAKYYINNQKSGLEVYISGATQKYVTVTGNAIGTRVIMERGEQLQKVLDKYMLRRKPDEARGKHEQTSFSLSDDEVLKIAAGASNGAAFMQLWNGDASGHSSHSEADLALCNLLAFYTGKDAAQMDRLFRQSGLMRPKWDRPQSGSTYGAITIQEAINGTKEVYRRSRKNAKEDFCSIYDTGDYTDLGNAYLFKREYGARAIYSPAYGWLVWNGKQWAANDTEAGRLATLLADKMLEESTQKLKLALNRLAEATLSGDKEAVKVAKQKQKAAEAYRRHAINTRNKPKITALLELAKYHMSVDSSILDADPFVLNTPAGIVDLGTGEIRPHDPEAYCTKITAVSPDAGGAEMWRGFLSSITCGNAEKENFLQQVAGMATVGKVFEESLVTATGESGTGKSTYHNTLAAVLGDYAGTIDPDVLTTTHKSNGAELATLRGKRLVIAAETEEGQRLSGSFLKRATSTDKVHAERKYKDPEDFTPTHTLILYTNHLPKVGSTDGGTWRRILVVPFDTRIKADRDIKNYSSLLVEKAGGAVLSWMIEGAVQFCANAHTLAKPSFILNAVEQYRDANDWLGDFLEECCVIGKKFTVSSGRLYSAYREYALASGEYARNKQDFNTELRRRGLHDRKGSTGNVWYGIGVKIDGLRSVKTGTPWG